MPLQNGTFLGPYEIIAPLGAGAMGEVYKARDARLDRTVAIKILTASLASDRQFRERFEREARALSRLTHPHICTLYDVGRESETSFLVMEYVEGETLDRVISRGPMPLDQALKIASEIAGALDSAHRVGIVHRDLKPGNIMLARDGVKLLDFGVAKFTSPVADSREDTLTVAGALIGTVQYMAPEQLLAGHVDARTDIFALGAVLYEMITREKAFTGASQASVIAAILERDSSADKRRALAPPGVDRVVRKCLRKNPDERWQSARDLGDEVRWLAASGADTPQVNGAPAQKPAQNRRRRFTFRLTIGFSLSILMMVVTYTSLRRSTPPPTQVAQVAPPPTIVSAPVGQRAAARSAAPDLVSNPEVLAEPETRDIPRGSAEAVPEYTARVRGIQVTLAEGKAALAKGEYGGALARFRLVARAAPTFKGVDALIADATARQRAAVDKAIENGQQNETANNLMAARRWYDQALQLNPSSVVAREKRVAVMAKMNHAAAEIYSQAMAAQKIQNLPLARRLFQQVFDQTMPGDEYREKAQKQLGLLR